MGRIDYLHDPDAPPANSVVPSVVAFVQNDAGQVLMIQWSDNGRWALLVAGMMSASPQRHRRARSVGKDRNQGRSRGHVRDLHRPRSRDAVRRWRDSLLVRSSPPTGRARKQMLNCWRTYDARSATSVIRGTQADVWVSCAQHSMRLVQPSTNRTQPCRVTAADLAGLNRGGRPLVNRPASRRVPNRSTPRFIQRLFTPTPSS